MYETGEPLGKGGMGEVYRARDTKLGREVALKVLPPDFARDAQRMARFEREARLLASLNHPHIASIYGMEDSGDIHAIAMELVEGPTLAERIAQGPLPLEEALPIARQIAEALEYAHEHGVIHRDLKPANVKLTREGEVKILDFGLAKALESEAAQEEMGDSPTISAAATRAGVLLGTAAYMSPEQARGRAADKRADIWAFGCVLFEMLAGKRAFHGETSTEAIASVMKEEPRWKALPENLPGTIRQLLRRCLEKDPKRRLRDVGEARIAIEEWLANPRETAPGASLAPAPTALPAASVWRRALPWGVAGVFAAVAALAIIIPFMRKPQSSPVGRFALDSGGLEAAAAQGYSTLAISPDGREIVYVKTADGKDQLYLRSLDRLESTPLQGTENARDPFFSPDGQWVGFFADQKLKKIRARGGDAISLCDAIDSRGASWSEDGTILFAGVGTGLLRVSASGGTPQPVTKLENFISQRWPDILPGGKAALFTLMGGGSTGLTNDASVGVVSLPGGQVKRLPVRASFARYVAPG